jgi:hypothetical protein
MDLDQNRNMHLDQLVGALLAFDALSAREWIQDATRAGIQWHQLPCPTNDDSTALAVAAGIVELMAERSGQEPPDWTREVRPAPKPVFLVKAALTMPRLRKMCEDEAPMPLKRRRVFAPPNFLSFA